MRIIARLLFAGTAMITVLTVCALVSRLPAAYATNEVYSGWSYHLQRVERDGVEVPAEDADAATWVDGGSGILSGSTSGVVFVNRREQIYATTHK